MVQCSFISSAELVLIWVEDRLISTKVQVVCRVMMQGANSLSISLVLLSNEPQAACARISCVSGKHDCYITLKVEAPPPSVGLFSDTPAVVLLYQHVFTFQLLPDLWGSAFKGAQSTLHGNDHRFYFYHDLDEESACVLLMCFCHYIAVYNNNS